MSISIIRLSSESSTIISVCCSMLLSHPAISACNENASFISPLPASLCRIRKAASVAAQGQTLFLLFIILPLIPFFKRKRQVGGPLRAQRDPSAHPCGGDIPRWQLRPDAGLRPAPPCGGHPVGQQEIHEHEALGGGSGRRLYCRLTSFSRSLQTILRINLTAPMFFPPFSEKFEGSKFQKPEAGRGSGE